MDRREWLGTNLALLGSLAGRGFANARPASAANSHDTNQADATRFRHRGYLGWITDLATTPDTNGAWPSMRLDERLLEDYRASFDLMARLGFNEISIWGLYVSHSWPTDIASAVSAERGAMVERLIDEAHKRGIRVYSGLGVYSWGFDEIIRAHPELSRGNSSAMCASEPKSWDWMRRVIDFAFERFPIDGVSMQSADQGRCKCEQCKQYSDAEYHALLNVRAAEYIRSRRPGKTVGVNSWGMNFGDPKSLDPLVRMSKTIDYLIDVHDTSSRGGAEQRKRLIDSLQCDFGTLGGPQVEPPQHWNRDRWFLPTAKQNAEHLTRLREDGGRACEYFFHVLANPGDEISMRVAGMALSDPKTSWEKHLEAAVEQAFEIEKPSTRDALIQIFADAEEAYFNRTPSGSGTLSLEPLVGDKPGPPIYLNRLNPEQRAAYKKDLDVLKSIAARIAPDVPRPNKMRTLIRCLENVIRDVGA